MVLRGILGRGSRRAAPTPPGGRSSTWDDRDDRDGPASSCSALASALALVLAAGVAISTGTGTASAATTPTAHRHVAGGQPVLPPPLTVAHLEDQPSYGPPVISTFPSVSARCPTTARRWTWKQRTERPRSGSTSWRRPVRSRTASTSIPGRNWVFLAPAARRLSPSPAISLSCSYPAGNQLGWMQIDQLETGAGDTVIVVGVRLFVIACGHAVGGTIALDVVDGTPGQGYYLQDPFGDIAGRGMIATSSTWARSTISVGPCPH